MDRFMCWGIVLSRGNLCALVFCLFNPSILSKQNIVKKTVKNAQTWKKKKRMHKLVVTDSIWTLFKNKKKFNSGLINHPLEIPSILSKYIWLVTTIISVTGLLFYFVLAKFWKHHHQRHFCVYNLCSEKKEKHSAQIGPVFNLWISEVCE